MSGYSTASSAPVWAIIGEVESGFRRPAAALRVAFRRLHHGHLFLHIAGFLSPSFFTIPFQIPLQLSLSFQLYW